MSERAATKTSKFFMVAFVFSVFVVIVISAISYQRTQALTSSSDDVIHSYEIHNALQELLSAITDAELGQRGYIITRDTSFLEPYDSARFKVNKVFRGLEKMTVSNEAWRTEMDTLYDLINERMLLLATNLKHSEDQSVSRAYLNQQFIRGRWVTEEIHEKIDHMLEFEKESIIKLKEQRLSQIAFTPLFSLLLMLFSLFVFVLSYFKINKDIKILKNLNDELLVSRAEQEKTNIIFEEKNKELERSNTQLASFNHIASHDLKEPLRKIQTFINRLREKEAANISPTGLDYFERIQSSANHMEKLIEDLLMFSRTNQGDKIFEVVDLDVILERAKQELIQVIEDKNAVIISEDLPTLNVIFFQFEQLFVNLIGNSLKYSRPDVAPRIEIFYDLVDIKDAHNMAKGQVRKFHRITIRDNGIGFEQQYAQSIFTLFYRLHGKNEYAGTGIGLTICEKIAENHGGFISASGTPGKGATFHIHIPI